MGRSRRYPVWEHNYPIEGNKNRAICKYCGHMIKSGEVTWLKYHLSSMKPAHNVQRCENVPLKIISYILG